MVHKLICLATVPLLLAAAAAHAQPAPPPYATLADLTLAAPVIVRAQVAKVARISPRDAPGLAPGSVRLLITATVQAALTAPAAIPTTLSWLQDLPADARGRAPDLRKQILLAWLQAPAPDGKTTLLAGPASQPWSDPLEARVRAIATEARSGTVPIVTGVANGFRVPGTVPGEAESQFFLTTRAGKPLTMVVLDRPGQARQIQVASTDIIDESATSVQPETLLWYRLACVLPPRLPPAAGGEDAALAAAWASAIASLGPCTR